MNRKKIELCVAFLALCLALCACKPENENESDGGPVVVVDPGPPFILPDIRSAHRLRDGSVVLLVTRAEP